jgi:hypothetical protein
MSISPCLPCACCDAVYTVKISRYLHCDCPDHAKGNLCKHILFVMLRVLKLSHDNPLVWQRALLTKEVRHGVSLWGLNVSPMLLLALLPCCPGQHLPGTSGYDFSLSAVHVLW